MLKAPMLDPRWRRLARVRLYCNASCIAAISAGCIILCGWIFHNELLKSALLRLGSVEVSTALGLILLGASLWLLLPDPPRREYRYAGLLLGSLAGLAGASALISHLFLRHAGGVLGTFSRMPPITAMTVVALGLALLLLDEETTKGWRPSQLLSLWGAFVATVSLSGYINEATAIYRVFSYTPVAVYTALLLSMMSAAVFFARPRVGIAGDLTGRFLEVRWPGDSCPL